MNDISPLPLLPPLRVCGRACVNFFCVRACASSATGASLSQPKGLVPLFFLLLSDPSSLYLLLALLFLLYLNGLFVFCIVFCVSSHQLIAVTHTPLPCFFFFFNGFCSYGSSKKTENIGCAWGDKEDWWVTKVLFLVYVSHTLLIGLCWAALLFYLPCMTKVFCH